MPPPGVLDPPEVLDQVGVLDQLDAKVKVYDNGRRPGGTVKRCEWRIRVRVRSKEKFWPRNNIQVELEGVRGTAGSTSGVTRMQSTTSAEVTFSGSDPHDYTVRANVEDWILVAPKDATLKNGDDLQTLAPRYAGTPCFRSQHRQMHIHRGMMRSPLYSRHP